MGSRGRRVICQILLEGHHGKEGNQLSICYAVEIFSFFLPFYFSFVAKTITVSHAGVYESWVIVL